MDAAITPDRECVLAALHEVIDPELGYNIVDLGMVYELAVDGGAVKISMTMTTPGCPAQDYILAGVYECARSLPGVSAVDIKLVWEPAWSPQRMTPIAKAHFGIQE
jgi:metal-sulfur cluster biosynthetic enzyme